jgi:hypothetical protein
MAQTADRSPPQPHRRAGGVRQSVHSLLLLLVLSALMPSALAVGPDTSARSFIILDDAKSTLYLGDPLETTYRQPTATAASVWALVGNSNLSGDAYISGACCTSYNYVINPVIVTGPFNGTAYATQNLYPPPLANPDAVERFGASLAIHEDRIAVGSTEVLTEIVVPVPFNFPFWFTTGGGQVHLYLHDGTTFVHERSVVYGGVNERFGQAVSLRANTLLVGRPGANPGAADLFDPNSGAHITTFTSPASGDKFGETVALLDDLALVGASGSGTVYVYRHDGGGTWTPAGTLASPGASSEFGAAIAVDNGRIVVGAPAIDRAYVFEDDGDADWPAVAEITGGAGSRLGQAVALTGDTAFIGAPQLLFGGGNRIGIVVRHERATDGTWPFVGYKASRKPKNGDGFGNLVSASSTLLSVVQNGDSTRPGEFYMYSAQANIWDSDGDTVSDYGDNCGDLYNPSQADFDGDDIGDDCDLDGDNDGLSNTEEDNIGTDPLNPDTDGDGLTDDVDTDPLNGDVDGDGALDGFDNCPGLSNPTQADMDGDGEGDACDSDIDGDQLSNADEALQGTNPLDPDSDDDLHPDGLDHLPLDVKDGWAKKYRFGLNVAQAALGPDVLLVLESDEQTLRSFAKVGSNWVEVAGPAIPGTHRFKLYGGGYGGNRFVLLERHPGGASKKSFKLLEWSSGGGWTVHNSLDISGISGLTDLDSASLSQNRIVIAAKFNSDTRGLLFNITPTGPQWYETPTLSGVALRMVGDYAFHLNPNGSQLTGYDVVDGFIFFLGQWVWLGNQVVTWPDWPEKNALGRELYAVSPEKAFVTAANTSFWMELVDGSWTLELSGIDNWDLSNRQYSGGNGSVVVHELNPAEQGGVELWRVHRVSDGSQVGKINQWQQGNENILTNGKVVVQIQSSIDTNVIDIYEVPAPPSGC